MPDDMASLDASYDFDGPLVCATCRESAEAGRAPAPHDPCQRTGMFGLVGRLALGMFVEPREGAIAFVTDGGTFVFRTDADCCSTTWIADLVGFDALRGARVVQVENVPMPPVRDGRCRQDFDHFYGVGIVTTRGRATLAYRNSSNGYYGGSISVFGERVADVPDGWREIGDDWSSE